MRADARRRYRGEEDGVPTDESTDAALNPMGRS